jgi:hypothetical protein
MWVVQGANTTSAGGISNEPETINNACVLLVQLHIAVADRTEMAAETQVKCPDFEVSAPYSLCDRSRNRCAENP